MYFRLGMADIENMIYKVSFFGVWLYSYITDLYSTYLLHAWLDVLLWWIYTEIFGNSRHKIISSSSR